MSNSLVLGETKYIPLPRGGTLEIKMTEAFVDKVRYQFSIPVTEPVTDEHIRMFIWGALNFAIQKAV